MAIDMNEQFKKALELMEEGKKHLFITGNAGTGKSTLLQYFRDTTKRNLAILAPTGVAAVNISGVTVHSFFGLKPNDTADSVYKFPKSNPKRAILENLESLVIDEISMVRADLLDAVDKSLRVNRDALDVPFGGVQMIFFGDLLQLPPVVSELDKDAFEFMYESPFFFDAFVMNDVDLEIVNLDKIYRQDDSRFIELLNAIRTGRLSNEQLGTINNRVLDGDPGDLDDYVYLATTNKIVNDINIRRLAEINSDPYKLTADIVGDFNVRHAPVAQDIELKIGSKIMMQNNDKEERWINGSIGWVTDVIEDKHGINELIVDLVDGGQHIVSRHSWDMYRYEYNSSSKKVESMEVGSFIQFPVRLAWAVTIHKSQGKTFDKVIVDTGWGAFAHGQIYVALSRCRDIDGLLLKKPLQQKDIISARRVVDWMEQISN